MDRCGIYFAGGGLIVDQAFQPRPPEGMIRCYLTQNDVVGFGHQLIKALISPLESRVEARPGPRIMHSADALSFQQLRAKMETAWVPAMQALLDISTASLPALWDTDFLYGPKTQDGHDTHVLCEINVSSVAPYSDSAASKVANVVLAGVRTSTERNRAAPNHLSLALVVGYNLAALQPCLKNPGAIYWCRAVTLSTCRRRAP